ncbi:hypothetical protein CGMCC3_g16660 [Colletotrichum fructicola]|nr:uncharacterized protein CGMCC3_g16660 [Colletotrichum fructicola]KAE9567203.1 hypothetical protein CGMCC3_g16660 [Colletotrichum fructicola]
MTRMFLSHVYTASIQLFETTQKYLDLSHTELPEDADLLCCGLCDAVTDLSSLWGEASTTLAILWCLSFELATFCFREAMETSRPSAPPLARKHSSDDDVCL